MTLRTDPPFTRPLGRTLRAVAGVAAAAALGNGIQPGDLSLLGLLTLTMANPVSRIRKAEPAKFPLSRSEAP